MRQSGVLTSVAIACAGLLAACGGGSHSTSSSQSSTTSIATSTDSTGSTGVTPPPTTGGQQRGAARGTLLDVVTPNVLLNGTKVSSRTDLHDHDVISTAQSGQADFSLNTKVKTCTALSQTQLEVGPAPGTLIRWDQGSSICVTSAGGGTATFGAGNQVILTAVDPVFQITVDAGTTTVKVDRGFVSVGVKGNSQHMIVGFNEQASVADGAPQGLGPFDSATDPHAAIYDKLEQISPSTTYNQPSPVSPGLQKIFQRGQITVSTPADPGSPESSFIQAAMTKLSRVWGLGPPSFVADGQADLSVTPQPGAAGGSIGSVPLFAANNVTWSIAFRADAGLKSSLQSFVNKYLNTGDYANTYAASFNEIPQYDALQSILFGG